MPTEMVSFTELAKRLGMDKTHASRYAKRVAEKLGIEIRRWRDPSANNQSVLAVIESDAERVVECRRSEGFLGSDKVPATDRGVFYVVQLVPDLDPSRIKLGFAVDMQERLSQHRTAAPTAAVLKTWPCRRAWETTVMESLVSEGCRLILNEVYECKDVATLLEKGNRLFELLPDPSRKVELSDKSPLVSERRKRQQAAAQRRGKPRA
jgi:DNA-binding MarR family transcriptional regulator